MLKWPSRRKQPERIISRFFAVIFGVIVVSSVGCGGNEGEGTPRDEGSQPPCEGENCTTSPTPSPSPTEVATSVPTSTPAPPSPTPEPSSPTPITIPTEQPEVDEDIDGFTTSAGDCNDNNSSINPDAEELCNTIDDNCNAQIDEGLDEVISYADLDEDGFGSEDRCAVSCNLGLGCAVESGDCDDSEEAINPEAQELCNSFDDNCDGVADEGLVLTWYYDGDGDGYGLDSQTTEECDQPEKYSERGGDCDDTRADVNPGEDEISYDGKDNDCAGGDAADLDHDGYTATSVDGGTDCDDANALVYPGATEIGDALDNDCDGEVDDGLDTNDDDGDCSCEAGTCTGSTNAECSSLSGGDCNDANPNVAPGKTEVCNNLDDNCSGQIDEGVQQVFYEDLDTDGYGNNNTVLIACDAPSTYATIEGDCNDTDDTIYPGANEYCDGIDSNCDEIADEDLFSTLYQDSDGDGYGSDYSQEFCEDPGDSWTDLTGDCSDTDGSMYPGNTEICDAKDNDCDGSIDEEANSLTYYRDADQDGFGTDTQTIAACGDVSGFVTLVGDCNDSNSAVNPNAEEVCDAIDNNCSDGADEICWDFAIWDTGIWTE